VSLGAAQSFHCFLHWIDFFFNFFSLLPVLDFSAHGEARALVKLFAHGPSHRGLSRLGAARSAFGLRSHRGRFRVRPAPPRASAHFSSVQSCAPNFVFVSATSRLTFCSSASFLACRLRPGARVRHRLSRFDTPCQVGPRQIRPDPCAKHAAVIFIRPIPSLPRAGGIVLPLQAAGFNSLCFIAEHSNPMVGFLRPHAHRS
jgi:hypothetical protein